MGLFSNWFIKYNSRVLSTQNAESETDEAKELVKATNYNYIIIDLNLPDGESIDFIREFDELFHILN